MMKECNFSASNGFASNLLYHYQYDYPNSFHNQTVKNPMQVQFPSDLENYKRDAETYQSKYYEAAVFGLKNKHKPYTDPCLMEIDPRMYSMKENYGRNVFQEDNLLYKENEELMREIRRDQMVEGESRKALERFIEEEQERLEFEEKEREAGERLVEIP